MPRTCTICQHGKRAAIESALVGNGTSYRNIAERFSVSLAALSRHKNGHLPPKLTKAKEAEEVAEAEGLLRQIEDLHRRTLDVLDDAESEADHYLRLKAISEARQNLKLLGMLAGELKQEGAVTIINSPQYVTLRAVIVEALAEHSEARVAVADALAQITEG